LRRSHLLPILLFVALSACKDRGRLHVETDEGAPRMATMIAMSNKQAAPQLLAGFYNLEDNTWRWTAGHFSVVLRPPTGAGQSGAVLKVQLNVPQPVLDRVKTTSLTATIKGTSFAPESFTQAGSFTFSRDVPAKLLSDEPVKVEFSLDKFLPAGAVDGRELGIVVTAIGFEPAAAPK
jgi:hypothetical protein